MRTVVLVHGAWHGPWCWAQVLAGLDEQGIPAIAVDLPGPDLHTDADHVRAALDPLPDRSAVLVGHSYGGAVVTDAGSHPAVGHLVYLCAFAVDEDETVAGLATAHDDPEEQSLLADAMRIEGDVATVDPMLAPAALYGDCTAADVQRAVSLLRPQPLAGFTQPVRAVGWRRRPVTYVVCGDDAAVPPTLQRAMAARIPDAAVVEWPDASHSPFLATPGRVVELLACLAGAAP